MVLAGWGAFPGGASGNESASQMQEAKEIGFHPQKEFCEINSKEFVRMVGK